MVDPISERILIYMCIYAHMGSTEIKLGKMVKCYGHRPGYNLQHRRINLQPIWPENRDNAMRL